MSLSTVTIYVTAQAKRDVDNALVARQATSAPSSVPTYASFCSGTSRYASACSCFNVTGSTYTAPTPTITIIITAQCTAPATCGSYTQCGANGQDCFCGYDTEQNAICFQSESCDSSLSCSSNADCAQYGDKTSCLLGKFLSPIFFTP